ncbi:MAG: endolytic transglycosylase MltG [Bacteroidales bacterium]|nr:endolytic transglycosylase MltG [Bacteroidales bacterium]
MMVKKRWLVIISVFALLCVAGGGIAYSLYDAVFMANVKTASRQTLLYIPTGSDFEQVCRLLVSHGLQDEASFRWVAGRMNYPGRVKPGRYGLADRTSNIELVRMLRSGRQLPVKVTFNHIRTGAQLAGVAAAALETDSASVARLFADSVFLNSLHLTPHTALSIFIPNTYELLWNTSAEEFWRRMNREYQRFWNAERTKKAEDIGFTPLQVTVLASIIEEETNLHDEKLLIAGVYMNRLKRNIPLQACPTAKYVAGDFTLARILKKHTEAPSPYNTYLHTGLPPGPICVPSIASIDAVLHYTRHDYLYFCAKADFSGKHHFSRTLEQHNRYAQEYQRALNRLNIYR